MKLQKAKKKHICDNCMKDIPKGDKYWNGYDAITELSRKEHTNCELYDSQVKCSWGRE
jgi:hypothetical protein